MEKPAPFGRALIWALLPVALFGRDVPPVTTSSLLEEMGDLARLARWPEPGYRTVQFSSYDRRSTHPEAPGWFSNSDGFGREPLPNFAAVLRQPDASGIGLYLVADIAGPGAIVRGWSAAMGGTLRVFLDDSASPIWEGPAYDFLARRSVHYMERAGISVDSGDAFVQQDADYFPIPFAGHLKVTWEGRLDTLHFYHLQVRLYEKGTTVHTFDPRKHLEEGKAPIETAVAALTRPRPSAGGTAREFEAEVAPDGSWTWERGAEEPGEAITEFTCRLSAKDVRTALRGTVLRMTFDGAGRPQVEAPLGDFFASGPGINPYSSLPVTVRADGTMQCRFVMPFRSSLLVELRNFTSSPVKAEGTVSVAPWVWDSRSMYFRAKWRADHDLLAAGGSGACDMPYVVARGRGLLVGAATMVVNPTPVPTSAGNWWGEGDEKIFVDDEPTPSTFGTGSEDYYNYSWSRPDLFDHPYCGQPLDSGPANAGYVSNHRWQITDAIPFRRGLAFYMELWHHTKTPGLSYARIAYHYARPGCLDDHRRIMASDLTIPELGTWEPLARGAASGSKFHHLEDLKTRVTKGALEARPSGIASRGRVQVWAARKGERMKIRFPIGTSGEHQVKLVALHEPGGGAFLAFLNGEPLLLSDGRKVASLKTAHSTRLLNVHFRARILNAGEHELALECSETGTIGGDYLWVRFSGKKIPGAVEAESLEIVARSRELEFENQRWPGPVFSGGQHLWVKAKKTGDFVELEVPCARPGETRVQLYLTKSRDYGTLRFQIDGKTAGEVFNAFNPRSRGVVVRGPVDLGVHDLGSTFRLRAEVTGSDPRSEEPHHYFGIDCVILTGADR